MTKYRIFTLILIIALLLAGCKAPHPDNTKPTNDTQPPATTEATPKPNAIYGWTGEFSEENFRKTIEKYQETCTPFVSDGTNGTSVSFETNLEGFSVSVPRVSQVDDRDINFEISSYLCQSFDAMRVDGRITVVTDWWHKSDGWTRRIPVWSYLVCVGDKEGAVHYFYFRVQYSTPQNDAES